ncbi:MAG: tetratricopeptide repeat protein [Dinghuibacter sp.]|nr:tetratricopeptide repeat protein [Dinghuibacter sp.]
MNRLTLFITLFVSASVCAQSDSARYYHELGKKARDERRFMVADKYFTQALSFNNNDEQVRMDQAAVLLEMRKYSQARMAYGYILEKNPQHKPALEQTAILCFNLRQWMEAEKYGKQCIEQKIGTGMHYRVAKSLYEQENYAEAAKFLEVANKEDPKNGEIPWLMANIWLDMNNAKQGIEMYEIAISLDSARADWHYDLGTVYVQVNDNKNAVKHFEKALALGMGTDLNSLTNIGNAYLANQQYDKGMEIMNKVLAKKPMDKTLYNDVAYAYYNGKRYKDAIEWWDRILTIDKGDAKALYMIGIAYQKDGNKEKGSKLCDVAIQMDPTLASLRKEQKIEGMGL